MDLFIGGAVKFQQRNRLMKACECVLAILVLSINSVFAQSDTLKSPKAGFDGRTISLVSQFPAGKVYTDSAGNRFIECKMLMTEEGVLIPEGGSPLEGFILLPAQSTNLTRDDIQDIFVFINYRELRNRIKRE